MNRISKGFTLIEISIVLVIIGLLLGGVLTGRDLIAAAAVRAQIAQIEKYNTAVNTFRGKYDSLPGDLSGSQATQFGFAARGSGAGQGNGDGKIEGLADDGATACGFCSNGETTLFWRDLSTALLIDGAFNTATAVANPDVTGSTLTKYLPSAKISSASYVTVWNGGSAIYWSAYQDTNSDHTNYFMLSSVTETGLYAYAIASKPALSVKQAYDIDKKMDDGRPQSGSVQAFYIDVNTTCCSTLWAGTAGTNSPPYTTATNGSATSCFDNAGQAGSPQQYSLTQNNGQRMNCSLSFRLQ